MVERRRRKNRGAEGAEERCWPIGEGHEEGAMSASQKICFHFKTVHSDAFSYTNSKVLFDTKCRYKCTSSRYSWRLTVHDRDEKVKFSSIS